MVKPIPKPRKRLQKPEKESYVKSSTGRSEKNSESEESEDEFVLPTNQSKDAYTSEKDISATAETHESDVDIAIEIESNLDEDTDIEDGAIGCQTDNLASVDDKEDGETLEIADDLIVEHQPEEQTIKKVEHKQSIETIKPPKPPPRRSERQTKKPKWAEDYHMNQITCINFDEKKYALNQLLQSGILHTVSPEVANKLWEAVMK
ncbi:uncharacterized protein LOC132729830 [Ruditapes philippinarum]|uniref:uncharacterized protein LOC132729830 n=1 Tax=Ruditapes philippinarum TaxID=129788 RepID=UPI00295A81B0|nr:uncharacterized protein LOC132729830 [Ruditapes philippinarum]XP_060571642.1 uncharacterized protein LOC132729830 [Ruditapes philippinarum]